MSAFTAAAVGLSLVLGSPASADTAGAKFTLSAPRHSVSISNSADRIVFWVPCVQLAKLTDAQLDQWKANGVGGFTCIMGYLRGLGGTQDFSGDPGAALDGDNFELQRRLSRSRIGERARARGMKLYLGFYAGNRFNSATPLERWFDGAAWSGELLPRLRSLAAGAKLLGFSGLAIDQELYRSLGDDVTWELAFPGNRDTESQVRAKVVERGRQMMRAMLDGFPGLELLAHDTDVPAGWQAYVERARSGYASPYGDDLRIDLWDGLSSVPGYAAIRWIDSTFYKTPRLPGASWEGALQYNANDLYAYLSRRLSNWSYASSRLHVSPFSWIDAGADADEGAMAAGAVAAQLNAFRRWGTGGEFGNFTFRGLGPFDYRPYLPGLRAASEDGTVDPVPPGLRISQVQPVRSGRVISVSGQATDNLAIRSVRWHDAAGRGGEARLWWQPQNGGPGPGWQWRTAWSFPRIPLGRRTGPVTITAEDIKGGRVSRTIRLRRG